VTADARRAGRDWPGDDRLPVRCHRPVASPWRGAVSPLTTLAMDGSGMSVWHERLGGMTYAWSVECPLNDQCLVRPLVHVIPGTTRGAVANAGRS